MNKKLYLVGGGPLSRAGRHRWFGNARFGNYRGFANFVETSDLRHAIAQYRRLPVAHRQLDMRCNRKATVLLYGRQVSLRPDSMKEGA